MCYILTARVQNNFHLIPPKRCEMYKEGPSFFMWNFVYAVRIIADITGSKTITRKITQHIFLIKTDCLICQCVGDISFLYPVLDTVTQGLL